MSDRAQLARLGLRVAAELDQQGVLVGGIVRRMAKELLDVPEQRPDGCAGCGAALDQPTTGRRRKWCAERCRSRARRR